MKLKKKRKKRNAERRSSLKRQHDTVGEGYGNQFNENCDLAKLHFPRESNNNSYNHVIPFESAHLRRTWCWMKWPDIPFLIEFAIRIFRLLQIDKTITFACATNKYAVHCSTGANLVVVVVVRTKCFRIQSSEPHIFERLKMNSSHFYGLRTNIPSTRLDHWVNWTGKRGGGNRNDCRTFRTK